MICSRPILILSTVWLLLMSGCGSSGFHSDTEATEKKRITAIAEQYARARDMESLKTVLEKELSSLGSSDSLCVTLIAGVFVADKTAEQQDGLNAVSTRLYQEAAVAAKQLDRADLQLWVAVHYGFYLYTYRELEEALGQFMFSIHTLNQLKDVQVIQPYDTYKKTAYFLMTVGDTEQAREHLLKAKTYVSPNSSELATITDALGLNSLHSNNLSDAGHYFQETLHLATSAKDNRRQAKALGNLAAISFRQKNYTEAIALLKRDIALSKKLNDTQNCIYALTLLGRVQLASGDYAMARQTLLAARDSTRSKPYLKSADYEISSLMLTLARLTGNEREELKAGRQLDSLKKDLAHLDGAEVIARMGWKMEKEKMQLRIDAEKANKEKEALQKIIMVGVCFMLLGLIVLLIRAYQKKLMLKKSSYEASIRRLRLDKEASEKKWRANSQSLQAYKTYLDEKNRQIKELEAETEKLKASSSASSKKHLDSIQTLLQSHLMSSDAWTEFKDTFIREHNNYYQHLVRNFGYLSDANLRVIFLLKLGMNNAEVARVLGLTLDAVKKSKQRLKKKYGANYRGLFDDGMIK